MKRIVMFTLVFFIISACGNNITESSAADIYSRVIDEGITSDVYTVTGEIDEIREDCCIMDNLIIYFDTADIFSEIILKSFFIFIAITVRFDYNLE